jgi:hypothetical protein
MRVTRPGELSIGGRRGRWDITVTPWRDVPGRRSRLPVSSIERSDAAAVGPADPAAVDKPAQTRARKPDAEGRVLRGQVRLFYEVYGTGEDAVLFFRRGRSCTRGYGSSRSRTSLGMGAS